ncbi:autotransporter outer membrane beta-barrel domain-containing protein [Caulobacter sp. UNC358MFTsu5.1]|uniref:autotransporter outer membrane beta-barrel domain-containing protein n=1 Tax=Caulobacter sp. UNC358MFTsu5.1 TaxID=1449049 RepID=UPI0004A7467D|nr:autotransporter outer membrane beta-barrel domain-containing protein [Caulobacter sp. UNC358MFTsu5.1]
MSRKFLATAALAPLLICGGKAVAETQVTSSSRTTPIATSTANSGAADDVKITSDGAITLSSSGAIATLDSDNTLTNAGSLSSVGVNDSIGVLVLGGHTGTLLNSATISLTEDYDYTDDDDDGDYDGLFAKGSGRYGIRVTGTDPFVGTITNDSTGAITIEGNDSAGISLETALTGSLLHAGTISVVGDRSYGVHTTGTISGNLTSTGSISVTGAGDVGLAVDGDVGGVLAIQGTIYSTGYRVTSRYTDPDDEALLDADDLLQGGGGVKVTANVAGGVLLDVPPTDTNDDTSDDEDGDGTTDSSEGSAAITAYGSAPALLIGSDTRSVTLGAVGTGEDAYGLIIRGSVTAAGVHDGISATGVQLGGDAGQSTIITGGVKVSGSIAASAYEGDAVALKLNAGAVADTLWNTGSIAASVTGDTAVTAKAVSIGAGSVMTSITNAGVISATVGGEGGSSYAIIDETGGLKTITNTGSIAAYVVATDDEYDTDDDDTDASNEVIHGLATAIDVSKNTTGVTIVQSGVNDGDDGDDGVADTDTDGDGVDDADEPMIRGRVVLGSGADSLSILNGGLIGDVWFGDGADKLTIDGTGYMIGALHDSDGLLDIKVGNGSLGLTNTETIKATSLTLGADSVLVFTVDPAAGTQTKLVVDTATVETGASLGLNFKSLLTTPTTYTVIQANNLTAGTIDQDLLGHVAYMYVANGYASGNDVNIDVRRRTAAEASLSRSQTAAYDAVFAALSNDDDIATAFLNQSTRDGFLSVYDQMLPSQGEGLFAALQTVQQQISAATANRPDPGDRYGPDSVWLQEINVLVRREDGDTQGSDTQALGMVAGYEAMGDAGGALGVTLAAVSLEEHDTVAKLGEKTTASILQAGLYWRRSVGGWRFNLGGGAGYSRFNGDRGLVTADVDGDGTADVSITNTAAWNGMVANAFAGVAYEARLGDVYLRPEGRLDYVWLWEGERKEHGGGAGFDLTVASREADNLSGDVGLVLGKSYGKDVWVRPELRVGYRKTLAGAMGDTIASFTGGTPFTLLADNDRDGAVTLGFALRAGSALSYVALEGGAEASRKQTKYTMRLTGRAMF